jgi:hypothetical protein
MDCTPHFTLDLPNIERDIIVNDGRTSKARVNCQSGYLRRCLGTNDKEIYNCMFRCEGMESDVVHLQASNRDRVVGMTVQRFKRHFLYRCARFES